jgi:uncharacterized phage protein gp47/JayE
MTFGVTPQGFNRKTYQDIKASIETKERARIDASVDLDPESVFGQLNGIFGEELAEAWEAAEGAYHSFDPNAAEGESMVNLALITGTEKRTGAVSLVLVLLELEAGTTVPTGSLISLATRDDVRFEILGDVTNAGGSTAQVEAYARCIEDGPVAALAGQLTNIVTPVGGWLAVTNNEDASLGRNADDTITLRYRRQEQLALRGGSTIDGIQADLLEVDTISDCVMLENVTDHFDPLTGLPSHAFEAMIVDDGLTNNDDVAQTIWESKPTGIASFGNTQGEATDMNEEDHVIFFSRAENRLVYVKLQISVSSLFAPDGETKVIEAVLDRARRTFGIADNVVGGALEAAAFGIDGVVDATAYLGFSGGPTLTENLVIGLHQIARFSSTRLLLEIV